MKRFPLASKIALRVVLTLLMMLPIGTIMRLSRAQAKMPGFTARKMFAFCP